MWLLLESSVMTIGSLIMESNVMSIGSLIRRTDTEKTKRDTSWPRVSRGKVVTVV